MKKYITIMLIPVVLGCLVFLFPRPVKAEESAVTHPEYDEETIHVCAENIWDLFYQLQGCPAMMEEVRANPLLAELYNCADNRDCLTCAAVLMFKLQQESDVWADTLGESEPAETVVEDVVYLLHEQTLLDEQLLQQAQGDNMEGIQAY